MIAPHSKGRRSAQLGSGVAVPVERHRPIGRPPDSLPPCPLRAHESQLCQKRLTGRHAVLERMQVEAFRAQIIALGKDVGGGP